VKVGNFFAELKRRNVYKVAVAYLVVAWLVIQAASILLPTFHAPEWVMQTIVLLLIVGFPVAVVFSWAFEITPEGIKRESEVAPEESITRHTGRKIVGITVVLAVLAAGLMAFQFLRPKSTSLTLRSASDELPRDKQNAAVTTISEKSIAILPFENLSDEKANAYFADGIQDEILTKLAAIADLKVISRTSTAKYKSKPEDLKIVSQELGVAHVLEGSVQRAGDKVRVNVQLVDARIDSHLWAKSYDGDAKDIFGVETAVSQQVADALQAKLSPAAANAIAIAPTNNSVAYDLFLRGEYEERRAEDELDRAAFDRAKTWYEQAIAADPGFALATARLVENRMQVHWFIKKLDQGQLQEVRALAERAISLDPNMAQPHVALGTCFYYGYHDYERALSEFSKAIQLQPNSSSALEYSGYVHRRQGKWEQCLKELQQVFERDPRNAALAGNLATTFVALRMWKEADETARRALKVDPHTSDAMAALLSKTIESSGSVNEALRVLSTFSTEDKMTSSTVGDVVDIIGTRAYVYLLARDFDSARKVWDTADKEEQTRQLCAQLALDFLEGNSEQAKKKAGKAKPLLEQRLQEVPDDILALTELGWVNLVLGEQSEALKIARQAAEMLSPESDALFGPATVVGLAQIQARTGDSSDAIAALRHLLSIPAGSIASIADLKMNPVWDPIRNDPGFQQLLMTKEHVGPLMK
jgi:TolB-like protein/cytochrome c-type biogenesis protein CcmH/NrfG